MDAIDLIVMDLKIVMTVEPYGIREARLSASSA
jgi:hypothetical protein